jgi:hypothetical protein
MRRAAQLWIAVALALGVAGFVGLEAEREPESVRPALTSTAVDCTAPGPEYSAAIASSQRSLAEAPQITPPRLAEAASTSAEAATFVLRVQDPEAHPLVGARVDARVEGQHVEAATDTSGACRLPKPEEGTHVELTVTADGCYPFAARRYVQDELVVTLFPLGALHGIVRDRETGAPIAGASVSVGYGNRERSAVTDPAGSFEPLDAPVATTFVLGVEASGYVRLAQPLTLRSGDDKPSEILLERARSARFLVVDAASGEPIPGATIGAGLVTYTSDDRGEVEVDRSFPPADSAHHLDARAPGYCEVHFEMASSALNGGPVQLALPRGCRIEGAVLDAEGRPASELSVRARLAGEQKDSEMVVELSELQGAGVKASLDLAGFGTFETSLDAEGRFTFEGIPPAVGAVTIEVERARRVVARRVVEVRGPAGSVERADIRLEPPSGATLFGRILLNGEPIAGRVRWMGAELDGWATAGPDGSWEATDVEPGRVTLLGLIPEYAGAKGMERAVEIARGARIECDLALELALATLAGRVLGPDGEPRPNVQLRLRSDVGFAKATTKEDGTWQATMGLTDGSYVVSASVLTLEGERVARAGDAHVDFHVVVPCKLRYRAVSSIDGSPVDRLKLQRRIGSDRFLVVALPGSNPPDLEGWCETELPEGEHEVFASSLSEAFCTAAHRVSIAQGIRSEVVFRLEPVCSLHVQLDEGQQPLPSGYSVALVAQRDLALLGARKEGRRILWSLNGGKEGPDVVRSTALTNLAEFRINGLAAGRYAFVVFPEDVILEPNRFDVSAPEQTVTLRWRAAN